MIILCCIKLKEFSFSQKTMTKTNTKLAVTVNIAKLKRAANCNCALLKLFLGLPYSEKSGISKLFLGLKSGVIMRTLSGNV